jgi:hypothetical protein
MPFRMILCEMHLNWLESIKNHAQRALETIKFICYYVGMNDNFMKRLKVYLNTSIINFLEANEAPE